MVLGLGEAKSKSHYGCVALRVARDPSLSQSCGAPPTIAYVWTNIP
jgi:hypothetical protein